MPDMVLEDVESDHEGQQSCEDPSREAESQSPESVPGQHQQQGETARTPSSSEQRPGNGDAPLETPALDRRTSQEDAETQTGRWTPFIESIKKEAEDVALATMEER